MAKYFGKLMFALPLVLLGAVSFAQDVLPTPADDDPFADERKVTLNLSVDRPGGNDTVKLKTKSGDVLAEAPRREKLEFEVVISGPHGDIPVYFDVPKESGVYTSYQQNKDSNPDQVLQTLNETVREPKVRIVARRQPRYADHFRGTRYRGRLVFNDPWRPFYEVSVPDSDNEQPVFVPIPESDTQTYQSMRRTLENDKPYLYLAELVRLSGSW